MGRKLCLRHQKVCCCPCYSLGQLGGSECPHEGRDTLPQMLLCTTAPEAGPVRVSHAAVTLTGRWPQLDKAGHTQWRRDAGQCLHPSHSPVSCIKDPTPMNSRGFGSGLPSREGPPCRVRGLGGVQTSPFILQVKLRLQELSVLLKVKQKQSQD